MDPGTKRRHRLNLPDLTGQSLSVVMALLAVLGFVAGAAPALFTSTAAGESPFRRAAAAEELAARGPHALTGSARGTDVAGAGPAIPTSAAAATADAPPGAGAPPSIRRVWFGEAAASAARDLRLQVAVSDPDSDVLRLRTRWQIDGRELETDTPVLSRALFSRGATIRATVVANDGVHDSEPGHSEEIAVGNAPPLFASFPSGFDATGTFAYELLAVDPDGDGELAFRLVEGPAGMQLGVADRMLRWNPSPQQTGLHRVRVEVRDGHGGSQIQHFELQIRPASGPAAPPAPDLSPG